MPVTSRLLQRLTEALGDDATNDLLVWLDEGNAMNRAVVRDMAEAYFARFDSRLEQRLAESDARLEQRLAAFEAKFERRLAEFDVKFERRLVEFDARFERRLAETAAQLRVEMAGQRADLIKWMFVFWIGTIVPLAGLIIALDRL